MITFAELQQKVKTTTKLTAVDSDTLQLIKDAINVAYLEEVRANPTNEFLVSGFALTATSFASGAQVLLPSDFLRVETVVYSAGGFDWELADYRETLPPSYISGRPRAYEIVKSTGGVNPSAIKVFPFDTISNTDTCAIDYYSVPARLSLDGDKVLSELIDENVIRRAVNYVSVYLNKIQQAREYMAPIIQKMPDETQTNN